MSGGVVYQKIVKEDLDLGHGTSLVQMPAGGVAEGHQINLNTFLPQFVNVMDYGAMGDGGTDDTAAIQSACAAAKGLPAANGGGGVVWFPGNATYRCASPLDLTDAFYMTFMGSGSRLLYTGAGAAFITAPSSQRLAFQNLKLHYNNTGFTGTLVTTGHSSSLGLDPAYLSFTNCEFAGVDGAISAAHAIDMDTCLSCAVRDCKFVNLTNGLRLGPLNYSNIIEIDNCTFVGMGTSAATMGACQSVAFRSCTFEASSTGKSAGIRRQNAFCYATSIQGCWFGDVGVSGGGPWVQLLTLGASVQGNFFGTAGSAAGDCCLNLHSCQGLSIQGNRLEGATNIIVDGSGGNSVAVWISGNDFEGTAISGQAFLSASQAAANNNLLNFTV